MKHKPIKTLGEPFIEDRGDTVYGKWFRVSKRIKRYHLYKHTQYVIGPFEHVKRLKKMYTAACGVQYQGDAEFKSGTEKMINLDYTEGVCPKCSRINRKIVKAEGYDERKRLASERMKKAHLRRKETPLPEGEIPWYDR